MALARTIYDNVVVLEGTNAEVGQGIADEAVGAQCILNVFYDGTFTVAFIKK